MGRHCLGTYPHTYPDRQEINGNDNAFYGKSYSYHLFLCLLACVLGDHFDAAVHASRSVLLQAMQPPNSLRALAKG